MLIYTWNISRRINKKCYQCLWGLDWVAWMRENKASFPFYMLLCCLTFFITHVQNFYLNKQKSHTYMPYCHQYEWQKITKDHTLSIPIRENSFISKTGACPMCKVACYTHKPRGEPEAGSSPRWGSGVTSSGGKQNRLELCQGSITGQLWGNQVTSLNRCFFICKMKP